MGDEDVWLSMAATLEEAAQLVIDEPLSHPVRRVEQSLGDQEKSQIEALLGSGSPASWISEASGAYLAEAGHELNAVALLIRGGRVAGSLEVLIRATLERVGRVEWLLDNDKAVTPRIRAIRASFEAADSLQHYRRAVEELSGGAAAKTYTAEVRQQRAQIEAWFNRVEKPVPDPTDSGSSNREDVSKWIIEGQQYPSYEDLTQWSLVDGVITRKMARGTYGALCAFSHPSFRASRESRAIEGGRVVFTYDFDYAQRLLGLGLFGVIDALELWADYFDYEHDRLVSRIGEIALAWDAIGSAV